MQKFATHGVSPGVTEAFCNLRISRKSDTTSGRAIQARQWLKGPQLQPDLRPPKPPAEKLSHYTVTTLAMSLEMESDPEGFSQKVRTQGRLVSHAWQSPRFRLPHIWVLAFYPPDLGGSKFPVSNLSLSFLLYELQKAGQNQRP